VNAQHRPADGQVNRAVPEPDRQPGQRLGATGRAIGEQGPAGRRFEVEIRCLDPVFAGVGSTLEVAAGGFAS
jgi:hypothetical protein